MKVIGIDPGTIVTGFGIIEHTNNFSKVLDYGTIRPPARAPLEKRYLAIYKALKHLIKIHAPQTLAVETQFVDKNVQSAIKLGMARGICLLAAAKNNLQVKEYSPTFVKKGVVGKGRASKEQVKKMISILLNINSDLKEDAADALALALCHIHTQHLSSNFQHSSWR